jgi:antitoxin component YwqK of YwqJK toxin-antitoxin module
LYSESGLLIYSGYWKNDKREGKGDYYDENGVIWYSGYWRNDKKQGKGICYDSKGNQIFKGTLSDNIYNGYGKRLDYNGDVYVKGDWKDDKLLFYDLSECEELKGFESFEFDEDSLYVGEVKEGKPDGWGCLWKKLKGCKMYEGYWANGLRHGYGKEFYNKFNPRVRFIGQWAAGVKEGSGTSYHENGKLHYRGYWKSDKLDDGFGCIFHFRGKIEKIHDGRS